MNVRSQTRLQAATAALAELVRSSRETMPPGEYAAFTSTALSLLAREGDRLAFGESLRALRAEGKR